MFYHDCVSIVLAYKFYLVLLVSFWSLNLTHKRSVLYSLIFMFSVAFNLYNRMNLTSKSISSSFARLALQLCVGFKSTCLDLRSIYTRLLPFNLLGMSNFTTALISSPVIRKTQSPSVLNKYSVRILNSHNYLFFQLSSSVPRHSENRTPLLSGPPNRWRRFLYRFRV